MASKYTRPLVYSAVVIVAVAGFLMTSPVADESSGPSGSIKKARPISKKAEAYLSEDYEATFEPVNSRLRNSFEPLVARTGTGSSGLAPNEFPLNLTDGEKGWFYTGTVIVDEVPSALIENDLTGEGMYLKVGEKFKSAMISEIAPAYIVVSTSAGRPLKMSLLEDVPEFEEPGYTDVTIEPVRPNVPTGAISGSAPQTENINLEQ